MATTDAIAVVSEALRALLIEACPSSAFPGAVVQCCRPVELLAEGSPRPRLTVCLYRLEQNVQQRNLPVQPGPGPRDPGLGLNLYFVVSAWGRDLAEEQRLLGALLATLHLSPVLDAALLRQGGRILPAGGAAVFDAQESLRLVPLPFSEGERAVLSGAAAPCLEAHSTLLSVSLRLVS